MWQRFIVSFVCLFFLHGWSFQQQDLTVSALSLPMVRMQSVHLVSWVQRIQQNAGCEMSLLELPNVLNMSNLFFAFIMLHAILGYKDLKPHRAVWEFLFFSFDLLFTWDSHWFMTWIYTHLWNLLLCALLWIQTFLSLLDGSDNALKTLRAQSWFMESQEGRCFCAAFFFVYFQAFWEQENPGLFLHPHWEIWTQAEPSAYLSFPKLSD